ANAPRHFAKPKGWSPTAPPTGAHVDERPITPRHTSRCRVAWGKSRWRRRRARRGRWWPRRGGGSVGVGVGAPADPRGGGPSEGRRGTRWTEALGAPRHDGREVAPPHAAVAAVG